MLIFLLGCATQTDAERYIDALADPDNPAPCRAIADSWLAGECVAMAATTQAGQGEVEAALATCEAMDAADPWRDECFFLIADRITAQGEQAKAICSRSGRYEDRCLGHAFGRVGRERLARALPGEERAVYRALQEEAQLYFDNPQVAGRKLWHMMVEYIASRDIEQPFSAATCGDLPEPLCRSGFLTRLRFAVRDSQGQEHTMHTLCQRQPVPVEAAVAVGLPEWTEDIDPVVQGAWQHLCGSRPAPR